MKLFKLFLLPFLIVSSLLYSQAPKWSVDLGEPIKTSNFMQEGKLLFFTSGEYVWCYDVPSGKEVWNKEILDFNENGISYLLGEMYLTNSSNKLQAYDAPTGNLLWEKEYNDIDQSDYMSFEFIENNAVFRYGEIELGVDLNNGNELYRMEIDYWGDLVNKGTFNYSVLQKQHKMLVMEDSEIATLFDVKTGKKLLSLENYDVNSDLIEKGLPWLYKSPDQKYLVFVLDNGAAVIDVANNKEFARKEFDIDGDLNVILPTKVGCAIMGEEKFVHFNFATGEINELNFPVDDLRTMYAYNAGGKDLVMFSMADRVAGIDLVEGKLLWETNDEDMFEGYIHRYLKVDGNNVIVVYNRARLVSSDAGTYLYLMSIDGLTGKVNYKTPALLSGAVWTNFQRSLTDVVTSAFSVFIDVGSMGTAADASSQAMNMVNKMLGYDYIGFDYETFENNGNIVFFSRSEKGMMNPENRESPGEGFVAIDYKTGTVKYRDYFEIGDGFNQEEIKYIAPILIDDDNAYVAGEQRLIKFDVASGKKLWEVGEQAENVTELFFNDGILYTKFGIQVYGVGLKEDNVEVKKTFDMDPYGFQAFDDKDGKSLWKVSLEVDPTLLTPQFAMKNYYNPTNQLLYFADEQNIYALKMGKTGGSYSWTFNYEQNGLGEMDIEESYAIKERWIGSEVRTQSYSTYLGGGWVSTTSWQTGGIDAEESANFLEDAAGSELTNTYESWGNIWGVSASRCLRVLYGTDVLLVVGSNAIAMINAENGSPKWKTNWEYDNDDVQYIPKIVGNGIVICSNEKLTLLDISGGSKIWEAEESDKAKFFESPHKKYFFSINDEVIKGYNLSK